MSIVRNFINVEGIAPESELPEKTSGEIVEYSEVDYIFIPEDKPEISNIIEIVVGVETKNTRIINSPGEKIVVIDGIKKFRIMCSEKNETSNALVLEIENPYNTFFEIPKNFNSLEKINIYIADAFFHVIDGRKIYSNILYIVDIGFEGNDNTGSETTQSDEDSFPELGIYNEFL